MKRGAIELNLYRKDFKIARDLSFLARILNAPLVLAFIFIGAKLGLDSTLVVFIAFGILFLTVRYSRTIYPDWPKQKYFIGEITFSEGELAIHTNGVRLIPLSSIRELVIFIDHYKDFSASSRDTSRTGNTMVFIKNNDRETEFFKFNVDNENQFDQLMELMEKYKTSLPYFREYKPYEISSIMKDDLSDRIIYN